jgi:hypothetical protein
MLWDSELPAAVTITVNEPTDPLQVSVEVAVVPRLIVLENEQDSAEGKRAVNRMFPE